MCCRDRSMMTVCHACVAKDGQGACVARLCEMTLCEYSVMPMWLLIS